MGNTNFDGMVQNPLCEPLEVREGPSKGFDGFGPMVGFNEKGGSPLEPISDGLVCELLEVREGPNLGVIGPQVGSPLEPNTSHKQVTIKEGIRALTSVVYEDKEMEESSTNLRYDSPPSSSSLLFQTGLPFWGSSLVRGVTLSVRRQGMGPMWKSLYPNCC